MSAAITHDKKAAGVMGKHFITSLIVITLIYIGWVMLFHFSSETMQPEQTRSALSGSGQTAAPIAYEDLAAAYETLQQTLLTADSTHIIRRYHGRHALFSADHVFDDRAMALSRPYFETQIGRERIYLDLPEFDWQRDDEARPVDVIRLTFRGNGIPENVAQLAASGLMEPKLHAFYNALIERNSIVWTKPSASVEFDVHTSSGEIYRAKSTPFIAVQRLSKDYFAKMKAASLPFLWKAYVDERIEQEKQRALLNEPHGPPDLIGPSLPNHHPQWQRSAEVAGPHLPRSQADLMRLVALPEIEAQGPLYPQAGTESILEALPELAKNIQDNRASGSEVAMNGRTSAVRSFDLDSTRAKALLEGSLVDQSQSLSETLDWKKAINTQQTDPDVQSPAQRHLSRLARLDPEFMTLFLIHNLFDQYNIFSVFEKNIYLMVNALDTRMNVLYVSYNLQFDPPDALDLDDAAQAGCNGGPIHISDEFFLVAAEPYSYLIRVYLPSCHLNTGDFEQIDQFLRELRILH